MKETFWLVWNPAARNPNFRHKSYEEAEAEASRLASVAPSEEFFVLQAMAHVKRHAPVTVTKLDEIPF